MTEQNKTKVPAELIPAGDYPVVSTDAVMDKQKGKTQEEVNEQIDNNMFSIEQVTGDKEYDASAFSGLGRKNLRKNVVDGNNVLTQEMMSEANTIYVIQYDYDINGKNIEVPSNCVLYFDGGKIYSSKGTVADCFIKYNNTLLAGNVRIEGIGPKEGSSIANTEFYADWFGLNIDNGKSIYDRHWANTMKMLVDKGGVLKFKKNENYYLHSRCNYTSAESSFVNVKIEGNGATIHFNGTNDAEGIMNGRSVSIWLSKANANIEIEELCIEGSSNISGYRPTSGSIQTTALRLENFINVKISNCIIRDLYGNGISVSGDSVSMNGNCIICNNHLINVGMCFGEGAGTGGYAISTKKCSAIISNNYIYNEFLDGLVGEDGNIHRRNWIGIGCGENASKELLIENNKIYGYDRAIHIEIVTPKHTQSIRNNFISGCDAGVVLWNINSNVVVENNTFYCQDVDDEHSYINSSVSDSTDKKFIYCIGPFAVGYLSVKKNYCKNFEASKSLQFIKAQSPYNLTSLPSEDGTKEYTAFTNISVVGNQSYDKYGNSNGTPIVCAPKHFDDNVFIVPNQIISFDGGDVYEYKTCNGNKIVCSEFRLGFTTYDYNQDYNAIIGKYNFEVIGNDITANTYTGFWLKNSKIVNNIFHNGQINLKNFRRKLTFDSHGHPSSVVSENVFDNVTISSSKFLIKSFNENKFIEYINETMVSKYKYAGIDISGIIDYRENQDGTTDVYSFYPASFNNAGTRADEDYTGHVRGWFKAGSRVYISQSHKIYKFPNDGWYALAGWYANKEFAHFDTINVNGFIYQNISAARRAKSGASQPSFPTAKNAVVRDNEIIWTNIGSGNVVDSKEWTAETVYEYGDILVNGNYLYVASVANIKSGATQPSFPQTVDSTVKDGEITWICRGACMSYEEET